MVPPVGGLLVNVVADRSQETAFSRGSQLSRHVQLKVTNTRDTQASLGVSRQTPPLQWSSVDLCRPGGAAIIKSNERAGLNGDQITLTDGHSNSTAMQSKLTDMSSYWLWCWKVAYFDIALESWKQLHVLHRHPMAAACDKRQKSPTGIESMACALVRSK